MVGCVAVGDTERDSHIGTMTLAACYKDRLHTILEHTSTSRHLVFLFFFWGGLGFGDDDDDDDDDETKTSAGQGQTKSYGRNVTVQVKF